MLNEQQTNMCFCYPDGSSCGEPCANVSSGKLKWVQVISEAEADLCRNQRPEELNSGFKCCWTIVIKAGHPFSSWVLVQ